MKESNGSCHLQKRKREGNAEKIIENIFFIMIYKTTRLKNENAQIFLRIFKSLVQGDTNQRDAKASMRGFVYNSLHASNIATRRL